MKYILYGLFLISIIIFSGYQLALNFTEGIFSSPLINIIIGISIIAVFLLIRLLVIKVTIRTISAFFFGLLIGLIVSSLFNQFLAIFMSEYEYWIFIKSVITVILCYLGILIGIKAKDEFNLAIPYVKLVRENESTRLVILDTSVIIDGRIADIVNAGFMSGKFIIPRFILKELQHIADSEDSLKRNRGRRGLDILNKIKTNSKIQVSVQEQDFMDIKEVDAKLVKLAKILGGKILTNDYNLNKIAELQGVDVLNINDLANALRPVVLPGENLKVQLVKKGKEQSQALAYLDDGTMIVVDESKHLIGKKVNVEVTSVLQTSAGRMIFAVPVVNKNR